MRIAIVNDLALARETLRRVVASSSEHEVAWLAARGEEAVARANQDTPDLILMDMIMPGMDGVEATRRIMSGSPCPILIVTSSVSGNIGKVYEAMGWGALDAVDTPTIGPEGRGPGAEALVNKISRIARMSGRQSVVPTRLGSGEYPAVSPPRAAAGKLVAVGASTGGPKALVEVLAQLPRRFAVPVVVVQHVDSSFAAGFVQWMAKETARPVELAAPGSEPVPGRVYVSRTDEHLIVRPDRRLGYSDAPRECFFRPSVDAFFHSLARHWGTPGVAVLLTGMGRDGAEGLMALRQAGWLTIAQDRASSAVWGMPRAAVELGAAAQVLPPRRIGESIAVNCR